MWADPARDDKIEIDSVANEVRGMSIYFGKNLVNSLLKREGLKAIIRAHEA